MATAPNDEMIIDINTKKEETDKIIRHNIYWAMGLGLVPTPVFDLAAITGVQMKMLYEFSKLYQVPFSKNIVKSVVASLIGGVGHVTLAKAISGSLLKLIPGVSYLITTATLPAVAGAITYAVGKVFVQHFESGGTFLDFDPAKVKKYFAELFKQGQEDFAKA